MELLRKCVGRIVPVFCFAVVSGCAVVDEPQPARKDSRSQGMDALEALREAPWIGDGRATPQSDAEFYRERPAAEFRARFVCPKGIAKPTLAIAAAGYYTLMVNGNHPSGEAAISLMPLWSPFDKTIHADRYVLEEPILKPWPQTNEVTVALGNGFYNLPPLRFWGVYNFRRTLAHGEPVFKVAVGSGVLSDWEWRESPVVRNCIYLGTEYDARRSPSEWRPAKVSPGPKGRIVPRTAPPIGVIGTLEGKARWLKEGSVQIVDFGENTSGIPEFVLRGKRGQKIEILYGERLHKDGSVNVLTQTAGQIKKGNGGPGAPRVAAQRDVYCCVGDGRKGEIFWPPFAFHACRYAEIRGMDMLLSKGEAKMHVVSSLLEEVSPGADFASGNEDLDRIHEMCRRTFRANLVGLQSDCPGRERLGYGGDIVSTYEAMILNYDMREFYLKTLQDFADEAADDGWITETAPFVGIASSGFGGRSGPVSWSLAVPELIDALLRHYDEKRALDYYPVCARYIRLLAPKFADGIIPHCIGDHEALERAPNNVTATAHWYRFVTLTASFARRLSLEDDAKEFDLLAGRIREAFARKFVGEDGVVANGTQSAQAIALYLGLVPEAVFAKAFGKLVEAVEKKDYAPHTGIFSTRYMLMCLSENGRTDVARKIVLHKGFPGYLYMLERGATTLWETWKESENIYSNCHPMFGSVDEWILKYGK